MPFKSEAQRRYLWANHPEVAREFSDATPKGAKLPDKVKHAYTLGRVNALERLGLKRAAEELRLKIPERKFHGLDAAHKPDAPRAKKADDRPQAQDSDDLEHMLENLEAPISPNTLLSTRDPLDRATAWGVPSNLAAGDTANRLSDMGQPTANGTVF